MKLVTEFGVYPHATITGRTAPAVDTGVDVHWPGPGRVYLHPQDVGEAVRACHQHEDVYGVLKDLGWCPEEHHRAVVDAIAAKGHAWAERAEKAEAERDALLATVQLLTPTATDVAEDKSPEVITDRGVSDVLKPSETPVKRGPGRPRKEHT